MDPEILQKLDAIKDELDEVQQEIVDIQNTLTTISEEVQHLGDEVLHQMALMELDVPYATIKSLDTAVQTIAEGRDDLAHNILSQVRPARELWLDALKGSCPSCQGQTIIEKELAYAGGVPVSFAQKMIRVLTTAQYLMSWAFERLGRLEDRDNDRQQYQPEYNDMWTKNEQRAFYMVGGCQWDSSMALTCSSATHKATKTFWFQNGTVVPAEKLFASDSTQSIPTHGSDHPEWSFDFTCDGHGYPVGMKGTTNFPDGDSSHYVAGFKLHCSDGSDTSASSHQIIYGDSTYFDFKLKKPMQKMVGCVNRPSGKHHTTYWASKSTISSPDGDSDDYTIDSGVDGCSGGGDPTHFTIDCGSGSVMQHFKGYSDVPDGHSVSYIAKMDITCVPWITTDSTVLV